MRRNNSKVRKICTKHISMRSNAHNFQGPDVNVQRQRGRVVTVYREYCTWQSTAMTEFYSLWGSQHVINCNDVWYKLYTVKSDEITMPLTLAAWSQCHLSQAEVDQKATCLPLQLLLEMIPAVVEQLGSRWPGAKQPCLSASRPPCAKSVLELRSCGGEHAWPSGRCAWNGGHTLGRRSSFLRCAFACDEQAHRSEQNVDHSLCNRRRMASHLQGKSITNRANKTKPNHERSPLLTHRLSKWAQQMNRHRCINIKERKKYLH